MRYIKQKNITIWIVSLLAILSLSVSLTSRLIAQTDCQKCAAWQAEVDPKLVLTQKKQTEKVEANRPEAVIILDLDGKAWVSSLDEKEVIEAMDCLLKLKGRKHDSKIVGATRSDTSQTFGASSVEIAALYYISYLYYQNWGHAGAAVLVDQNGKLNIDESVSKAYESYEKWFKKVKNIGLEEARKQKLDPLTDSGISWY